MDALQPVYLTFWMVVGSGVEFDTPVAVAAVHLTGVPPVSSVNTCSPPVPVTLAGNVPPVGSFALNVVKADADDAATALNANTATKHNPTTLNRFNIVLLLCSLFNLRHRASILAALESRSCKTGDAHRRREE